MSLSSLVHIPLRVASTACRRTCQTTMTLLRLPSCLLVCTATLLLGCEARPDGTASSDPVKTVILSAADGYPCSIRFEPTGVVLQSDSAGSVPDPGAQISRGPDGRFVTSDPHGGSVHAWSADGVFLRTIGRRGRGPGELGSGAYPIVDDRGFVHVIDLSQGRWNRYTPDGTFISSGTSPFFGRASTGESEIIGIDSLLTASPPPAAENQFHILDGDGHVVRAFGELPAGPGSRTRAIAITSNRTFWAAPRQHTPEYVLEEWTFDGTLVRRLERQVPWFTAITKRKLPDSEEGPTPLPVNIRLSAGPAGRLIVTIFSNGISEPLNRWYEVIDPSIPAVLASTHRPPSDESLPVFDVAPGSALGWRKMVAESGLEKLEIVRYRLDPSNDSGAAGAQCSG